MAKGSGRNDNIPMLYNDSRQEYNDCEENASSDIEMQPSHVSTVSTGGETTTYELPADSNGVREAGRGGKHEYLLKSGPLGMCNDPYCTTCPYSYVGGKANLYRIMSQRAQDRETSSGFWSIAPSWLKSFKIGVLNPHSKIVQMWNKLFVVSCLLGIFLDPLFFFLLSVDEKYKCIVLDKNAAAVLTAFRSLVDFIYLLHIILQFKLAYKDKNGELVDDPRLCKAQYLKGWFFIDVLAFLPLPQIMIMIVIPHRSNQAAGSFKDLLRVIILLQNIPRLVRFFRLIAGRSPTGFVFETAWANFTLNMFLYVLVAHVVGSCWYLLGVQRVNSCLLKVCQEEKQITCEKDFLDCGTSLDFPINTNRQKWIDNTKLDDTCLKFGTNFSYGIYQPMGFQVAQHHCLIVKYIYSLYWGFLQISTLAGNLVPSLYPWEALFTMGIGGLGLLMFASLIGNMQNFLQSLGRRRQEMQMRRYDVENFMERRRLPLNIRKKVRGAERFKWVATHGVEDEEILSGLPEDLQIEIKCFVCHELLKGVRLFKNMDKEAQDAIYERLRLKVYVKGSKVLRKGCPVKRMYFIVRGSLTCVGQNGSKQEISAGFKQEISAGQFCGEELLIWHLEQTHNRSGSGRRLTLGQHAISSQDIECLENVDAFVLEGDDIAYITKHYGRLLRTPRVRGILRNDSTSCRLWAVVRIQMAWRYKAKKRKAQAAARRSKDLHRSPTQSTKSR